MRRSLVLLCLAAVTAAAPLSAASWAIGEVRLFDGAAVVEGATVLVRDETIVAAGSGVSPPPGVEVIDGRGRTVIPGLIDCHTHSWGEALERSAVFGVTTVVDMFTEPGFARRARREQRAGEAAGRADLFSAGVLATAPGGHGTQYGIEIPTLSGPDEADAWVAARLAEGSDFIKIVLEDGSLFDRSLPTLDLATATAVTEAAHDRGLLAVAHATTFARAEDALAAGVDGLVHAFRDRTASAEWAGRLAAAGVFVVPTLTVVESSTGKASGESLVEDERLAGLLTTAEKANLGRGFPAAEASPATARDLVRTLYEAGVVILAGTDAPNPGTAHGASMHRELELLVEAGMSPRAALAAATASPAATFGLTDRGRIAPGLRADLVLVEGDPLSDIVATRAIVGVWKGGVLVERPVQATRPSAPVRDAGGVADFEEGKLAAAFGFGWAESTDDRMGGESTVELRVVEGGANGSARALSIEGEIRSGFAFPWAGAIFFPGSTPMAPVDLSAADELAFWAKGSPGSYRVLAFAESLGPMPAQQTFEVGREWRRVVLPLAGFAGADRAALTGLLWTAGPELGAFELVVDEIELR